MPYKDPEIRKQKNCEKQKAYREKNGDKIRARERERRKNDPEWAEKQRAKCRKWLAENADYRREKKREWEAKNPESRVATQRKTKLGISREEQEALFASQNAQCAICGDEIDFVKSHLDHCHKTMRVRGFLCQWCNSVLGHAKDDPARLEAAIDYLRLFVDNVCKLVAPEQDDLPT